MNKTNIIGLILAGLVLGSCGVINLAYAGDPTSVGKKEIIPQGGPGFSKPTLVIRGEDGQRPLAASLSQEEEINSLIGKIRNGTGEARNSALAALMKIILDPKADPLFKKNAIASLLVLVTDKTLGLQTRKDVVAVLAGIIDFSQVSDSLKQFVVDSLAKMVNDKTIDSGIRHGILLTLYQIANGSRASDDVKQNIISSLVKTLRDEALDDSIRKDALWAIKSLATAREDHPGYGSGLSEGLRYYLNKELNK